MSTRGLVAIAMGVMLGGCMLGKGSPAPSGTRAPDPVYSLWEFETLGEVDQFLDVKTCEGWRLAEAFSKELKIIVIITRDGPAPPPDPKCRPSS